MFCHFQLNMAGAFFLLKQFICWGSYKSIENRLSQLSNLPFSGLTEGGYFVAFRGTKYYADIKNIYFKGMC